MTEALDLVCVGVKRCVSVHISGELQQNGSVKRRRNLRVISQENPRCLFAIEQGQRMFSFPVFFRVHMLVLIQN